MNPAPTWPPLCQTTSPLTGVPCGQRATQHLLLWMGPLAGWRMLHACDMDTRMVLVSGLPVQQWHVFADCCGMPGTNWDRELNRCVIDASGVEPALREKETAHV
jgi:hypothetical protein